jgi:ABC-type branched-subunit amino acid transport system substrate-binding protein
VYRLARPRAGGFFTVCAAILACLVAACNSSVTGGLNGGVAGGPVGSETLGTGTVKIALILPLSAPGNAGQIAKAMRNAAELALREFKTANIQILVKDDRGSPDGARAAATQAISEGAELILGPLFALSVPAVAGVVKPATIPVIAFSTDASNAQSGVYLLSFLPQTDVERIVRYGASKGKKSFAAILPSNAYGAVVEAALQKAVSGTGGRVIEIERYDVGDNASMQAKVNAIAAVAKQGTVDAILMPDGGTAPATLAQLFAAAGVKGDKIKFMGSGQWDDAAVAGEPNLNGAWYPAPDRSGYAAFSQRYQAAFGQAPFRPATLAYDATSLAAGLSGRFGAERFKDATLTSSSGFIGLDGAFRLLPSGLNERGLAVYEIEGGGAKIIDPAPKSFAKPGT